MNKGCLYIVSGPSGSGKDTILKEVFSKCPELFFSISSISRPMRPGEVEGEKYHFISKDEFLKMAEKLIYSYETIFIIDATLEEEAVNALKEKFTNLIAKKRSFGNGRKI